jgi:two-component system cell cycle response regulator
MAGRVLVIEDNEANLELMVYLLQAFGHHAIAAENGEKGLELARRESPDVILCDIQLPDIDGFEVVRQLMKIPSLRGIPRVAVTAMAMVGDRDKLLAAGFDGYIGKPIQPETLVQEVEAFLPAALASQGRAAAPPPAATVEREQRTDLGTILLVDDVAANIDLGRSILEPAGYRVIVANSVVSALQEARLSRPDLILSDVHMPQRDGYDLFRELCADSGLNSIPFVFISSTSNVLEAGHPIQGLGLPRIKLILRPIEAESLLAEIESSLQKPETGETAEARDG